MQTHRNTNIHLVRCMYKKKERYICTLFVVLHLHVNYSYVNCSTRVHTHTQTHTQTHRHTYMQTHIHSPFHAEKQARVLLYAFLPSLSPLSSAHIAGSAREREIFACVIIIVGSNLCDVSARQQLLTYTCVCVCVSLRMYLFFFWLI